MDQGGGGGTSSTSLSGVAGWSWSGATPGHLAMPPPLQSFSAGSLDRGVFRQHHSPIVHPLLGRVNGDHIGAPVHRGGMERSCGCSEPSGTDHRLRMDLVSGGGRRVGEAVAGDGRFFCHLPQLLSSSVFLLLERFDGSEDGCLFLILGWAPGLFFPVVCSDLQCSEQASVQQGYSLTLVAPLLEFHIVSKLSIII